MQCYSRATLRGMEKNITPVVEACKIVGSQVEMARALGVTPAMVNQMCKGLRPVPVEHCATIERLTEGKVTRQTLRPNDFWRIWPDLPFKATQEAA
jgi:DNA-binding transcriptional regulator YdaS (Cro superfamily)